MKFKNLVEEIYKNTLDEGTRENDFRYNKDLQRIPKGADPDDYEWEDEIGYVKKAPRKSNGIRQYRSTIEKYLEKKPFKKFSMKQAEIIFKAVNGKQASKLIDQNLKLIIYGSGHLPYMENSSGDNACFVAQWFEKEKYLGIGFWLKDDFAFLKGGKVQTVYVDQEDIEKYYGMKIGDAGLLNNFEEGDLIFTVGEGKKDGKPYCDSVVGRITEFLDPYTVKVNILKSEVKDNDLHEKEVGTLQRVNCFSTIDHNKVIDTITISIKDSVKVKKGDIDVDITRFVDVSKLKKFLEPISYSKVTVMLALIRRHGLDDLPKGFKK